MYIHLHLGEQLGFDGTEHSCFNSQGSLVYTRCIYAYVCVCAFNTRVCHRVWQTRQRTLASTRMSLSPSLSFSLPPSLSLPLHPFLPPSLSPSASLPCPLLVNQKRAFGLVHPPTTRTHTRTNVCECIHIYSCVCLGVCVRACVCVHTHIEPLGSEGICDTASNSAGKKV